MPVSRHRTLVGVPWLDGLRSLAGAAGSASPRNSTQPGSSLRRLRRHAAAAPMGKGAGDARAFADPAAPAGEPAAALGVWWLPCCHQLGGGRPARTGAWGFVWDPPADIGICVGLAAYRCRLLRARPDKAARSLGRHLLLVVDRDVGATWPIARWIDGTLCDSFGCDFCCAAGAALTAGVLICESVFLAIFTPTQRR